MPYHTITSTCWLALESNKGLGYGDPQFCCLSQMASLSTPDGNRATDPHNTLQLVHHQCQYPRLSGQGLAIMGIIYGPMFPVEVPVNVSTTRWYLWGFSLWWLRWCVFHNFPQQPDIGKVLFPIPTWTIGDHLQLLLRFPQGVGDVLF